MSQMNHRVVMRTATHPVRGDPIGAAVVEGVRAPLGLEGGGHRLHGQGGEGCHQMTTGETTVTAIIVAAPHSIRPPVAPTQSLGVVDEGGQGTAS